MSFLERPAATDMTAMMIGSQNAHPAEKCRRSSRNFPLVKAALSEWKIIPVGPFVNSEKLFVPSDGAK
ncbi:hypothetical protein IY145_17670 [Methylosinus sp. H3A]|uniref:hypothetical protein n=1 Tax=Methylosinus sp. H3A TaxID=2785786 RepID=UPI0018C2A46D|nr:hypothetical protein [Methylosinus sp. H3A]MBG0811190.1 hypothetical protein [Methylosinus sp. H3A]